VLRSLFELLGLSPAWRNWPRKARTEPVKQLLEAVSQAGRRVLTAGTDLQGKLTFWGKPLLTDDEIRDWRTRLEALKTFTEGLTPYNTVGKLKNLRIGSDDIDAQKKNLEVLAAVEKLLELVTELGSTAAYLSQAEMVLSSDHAWVKQAQSPQGHPGQARFRPQRAACRRIPADAGPAQEGLPHRLHRPAQQGAPGRGRGQDQVCLRKDSRLVAMRALAGIALMPTSQLTTFDDKLDKLKSCASLVESELSASPYCPHCSFRPANEQGDFLPAANVLKQLDEELDRLLDGWQQTLLDNLDDPIIQANLDLLKASARELIKKFVASKKLADPVTPDFVSAVQEALSGLEKIASAATTSRQRLLQGGSPATPDDLRKRFETFLNERCKGKDASKLRFVVE
jgi:hypothetical protein